jgi:hypothetical protein
MLSVAALNTLLLGYRSMEDLSNSFSGRYFKDIAPFNDELWYVRKVFEFSVNTKASFCEGTPQKSTITASAPLNHLLANRFQEVK